MALNAVGIAERLAFVRLDQIGIFRIVTIEAQHWGALGQVVVKLLLAPLARLVGDVAGLATHVERRVTAAVLRNVHALVVAAQTDIVVFARP